MESNQNPMILKYIRMPLDLIGEIAKVKDQKKYNGFAETTRELCLLGLHVLKLKPTLKDPEFVAKLKSFKDKEQLIDYIFKGMPENERNALQMALQYSKED